MKHSEGRGPQTRTRLNRAERTEREEEVDEEEEEEGDDEEERG